MKECACGCGEIINHKGLNRNVLKYKFRHINRAGLTHWKGGRCLTDVGYVEIYSPKHPFANHHGYVAEHRLVMEKIIKRYLRKDEVVHHISDDRLDNRIENLRLMTQSEHMKIHAVTSKKPHGINCIKCQSPDIHKDGKKIKRGVTVQAWQCSSCGAIFTTEIKAG